MSFNCDPEEVLHHLNLLGYENVSEEQLRDFIRDLKKLIKYDKRKNKSLNDMHRIAHNSYYIDDTSYSSFCSKNLSSDCADMKVKETRDTGRNCTSEESYTSCETSSTCTVTTNSPKYPKLRKQYYEKKSFTRDPGMQNRGIVDNKMSKSFIRSWQLNQNSCRLRNDPVTRYQWYQSQWNKQKVPGEEPHKQLRWLVREKMLGDNPHPRPSSQASGQSSRK